MKPKISIIVPVYNVELYLKRCIDSLVNQTIKEIEIILVDDESTDNCPQICDEYALRDNRIQVIHKKNGGLGYARNSGLEIATGEYVTFVDSDDFMSLGAYEMVYDIASTQHLDACYFKACRFMQDGTTFPMPSVYKHFSAEGKNEISSFLLDMVGPKPEEKVDEKFSMSVCMGIFRLELLKEHHLCFVSERKIASEDLIFSVDFLQYARKIRVVPYILYHYFINPNSITTTYNALKYERMMKLLEAVDNRLSTIYSWDEYKEHYYTQILRIYKIVLRNEAKSSLSFFKKVKNIKKVCSHPNLDRIFADNVVTKKYSLKNRGILFCMKHKMATIIIGFYNLFKTL